MVVLEEDSGGQQSQQVTWFVQNFEPLHPVAVEMFKAKMEDRSGGEINRLTSLRDTLLAWLKITRVKNP